MTAQRSKTEVDRLDAKAARIRSEIYLAVRGRPGFNTAIDKWPESPEKRAAARLWNAHKVYFSAVSAETKYNTLRNAMEFAEAELANRQIKIKE